MFEIQEDLDKIDNGISNRLIFYFQILVQLQYHKVQPKKGDNYSLKSEKILENKSS